jgi:phenylpropionate dioxygenase-like ring-hydroxylating dioxygenase large terminal subunit
MSDARTFDRNAALQLTTALSNRRFGYSLPGRFYNDHVVLDFDYEHVWHREWVFAGNECELSEVGAFLTMTVGSYPLIVVRGDDGVIRALHNVCRHRGSLVCEATTGVAKRRFVCPYHQWSYGLDGALANARGGADELDLNDFALGAAHCETVGGLVFVSVAPEPPDFAPVGEMVEPYLTPFDLRNAKVAFDTTIIEHGNWKLVMENNRECYHCRATHPELSMTFPLSPLHSGGGDRAERAAMDALVERCEADGLPSRFVASDDFQYRAMRMAFTGDNRSMTMDGAPAVARQFGTLPSYNIGDVLLYHYPSMWSHFTADHAVTFRIAPTGPTTTELRTTWLVPRDAVEGVDYHLDRLTEVWNATNAQDTTLVERAQRGVSSPAYRPGPYTHGEEDGVIQFVNWYAETALRNAAANG